MIYSATIVFNTYETIRDPYNIYVTQKIYDTRENCWITDMKPSGVWYKWDKKKRYTPYSAIREIIEE